MFMCCINLRKRHIFFVKIPEKHTTFSGNRHPENFLEQILELLSTFHI